MKEIKQTESLCPECLKVIPATIYEESGKVYLHKVCPEHGEYSDLYWGDYEEYTRAQKYEHLGTKLRTIPVQDFIDEWGRIGETADVEDLANEWAARAQEVVEPSRPEMLDAAKTYFAARPCTVSGSVAGARARGSPW